MASTILLKHGPGAPTSGELEYRELGYDHTNHKLYIGNSSGGVTLLNPTYSLSSFGVTATAAELNRLDGITATTAELNYTDGVTSNIQTQLNGKAASSHTHPVSQVTGLTASRALISDGSGHPAVSAVTSTELGYLDGVTSSIQTQLNGKAASSHTHNYAGSSSAGGAANSANKLNTNAGSSTQPVYFSGGKPVAATSYDIAYVRGLKFVDTRVTNPNPSAYFVGIQADFKEREAIGVTSTNSTYGGLVTLKPYSYNSGVEVYQLILMYDGDRTKTRMFLRSAGPEDSRWGNWEEIFTEYICIPGTIVVKRNGSYVQEFSASTLTQNKFSSFYASSTVLAVSYTHLTLPTTSRV